MTLDEYIDQEYIPAILNLERYRKDGFFINQFYKYLELKATETITSEEEIFVEKYENRLNKSYEGYLRQLETINDTLINDDKDYKKLSKIYKNKTEVESIFLYWDNLNKKLDKLKKKKKYNTEKYKKLEILKNSLIHIRLRIDMDYYRGYYPRVQEQFNEIIELINNIYCVKSVDNLDFYIKLDNIVYIIKSFEFNSLENIRNNLENYKLDINKTKELLKAKKITDNNTIIKTIYLIKETKDTIFRYYEDKNKEDYLEFIKDLREFLLYFNTLLEIDYCLIFNEEKITKQEAIKTTYSLLSHEQDTLNKIEESICEYGTLNSIGFESEKYMRLHEKMLGAIYELEFIREHPKMKGFRY